MKIDDETMRRMHESVKRRQEAYCLQGDDEMKENWRYLRIAVFLAIASSIAIYKLIEITSAS